MEPDILILFLGIAPFVKNVKALDVLSLQRKRIGTGARLGEKIIDYERP
jgi:hypothetical protein